MTQMPNISLKDKLVDIVSNKYNIALLGLLLFQFFGFIVFNNLNKVEETWDSAGHIGMSYNIAEQLQRLLSGNISIMDFLRTSDYYPPFVQSIGAIISMVFGYNSYYLLLLTLFFFILSIVFVYIVAKIITKNSLTAFLTAAMFSLFPQVYEQSRVFQLDLPLVALQMIIVYAYIKSKAFTNLKYSIIFGIFFALGQLTKWYNFIYLIVPILLDLLQKADYIKTKIKSIFISLSAIAGLTLVIAVPWYWANYEKIVEYSRIFSEGEIDDPTSLLSLDTILYYPDRILSHQILLLPTIILVIALITLFFRNRNAFIYGFFSILAPMVIFTVIGNKNLRYIMPLTPLFALLISDFFVRSIDLAKHSSNKLSIAYKGGLVVFMSYLIIVFFFASYNQIKAETPYLKYVGIALSGPYYGVWYHDPQVYSYNNQYWPIREIWSFLNEDSNGFENGAGVTTLLDKKNFSLATFELIRREGGYNKAYVPVPYFQFTPFASNGEILDYLDKNGVKYVLATQDPGPVGLRNYAVLKQMSDYMLSRKNIYYEDIQTFNLPDGTWVKVFKKLPEGQTLQRNVNVTCKSDAGKDTGVEPIQLTPNHTYVFYTGHYAVDKLYGEYKPDQLYVVQIENIPHSSILNVYNLPHVGAGLCEYDDLDIDLSEQIRRPLTEPNNCGVDCQDVIHVKWSVGDQDYEQKIYTREQFVTEQKTDSFGIE